LPLSRSYPSAYRRGPRNGAETEYLAPINFRAISFSLSLFLFLVRSLDIANARACFRVHHRGITPATHRCAIPANPPGRSPSCLPSPRSPSRPPPPSLVRRSRIRYNQPRATQPELCRIRCTKCVCVYVRAYERERERERGRSTKSNLQAAECFPASPLVPRTRLQPALGPPDDVFRLMPRRWHYFRQKSFKSFSCRRLRAEVDSELFIRCRLHLGMHASRSSGGWSHYFPADRIIRNRAVQLPAPPPSLPGRDIRAEGKFYRYPTNTVTWPLPVRLNRLDTSLRMLRNCESASRALKCFSFEPSKHRAN